MNPEIKARWVAALRSGEYKQAKGALSIEEEGHCCLGVLCEIAVQDGVIEKFDVNEDGQAYYGVHEFGRLADVSETELPDKVVEWAGLEGRNPNVGEVCTCSPEALDVIGCRCARHSSLAEINDETGIGFEGIARIIEEQL